MVSCRASVILASYINRELIFLTGLEHPIIFLLLLLALPYWELFPSLQVTCKSEKFVSFFLLQTVKSIFDLTLNINLAHPLTFTHNFGIIVKCVKLIFGVPLPPQNCLFPLPKP
jgi:hypothetical protein